MNEVCTHCREPVEFDTVVKDTWTHWHGDTWCHDARGLTKNPLQRAQPTYHPKDAVL